MSTVILTRPSTNTYNHNKLSLHHQWDVSAKPFIPRPCGGGSSDESASTSSPPRVTSTSPEYHRPMPLKSIVTPKRVVAAPPSEIVTTPKRVGSSKPAAHVVGTIRPPQSVSLCEKPIKKTALMATTEYFMERWNKQNEIESVTHAVLNGTYLESRKNPETSTVPSLFDADSPFPPVLINQLPSLMSIWKLPSESQSFTVGIFGAHPEFAINLFRHDEGYKYQKIFK
uniref:Uncharacterized protein n=1 Tax=Panagrolaimus sp. ES5 TaxID=591445 RepID=A0AC34FE97_9BILA